MDNFSVKINGKEYWISRSTAVICLIYRTDANGKVQIVVNKRGKGCPDEIGKWNLVSGYISYDETIKQASSRETKEECGLSIPSNVWKLVNINSDPKSDKRQNITFRMLAEWKPKYGTVFTTEFSESDEVDEVRWIGIEDIEELDFAFNHKQIVENFFKERLQK